MSTTKTSTRVAVGFIAFLMVVSTLGLYAVMVLGNGSEAEEAALTEQYQTELQALIAVHDQKVKDRVAKERTPKVKELSDKYYPEFSKYKGRVKSFNAAAVKKLKTTDLKVGDGDEIKEGQTWTAYYIGWKSDEKIFDQSIDGETLKAPLEVKNGTGVIEGWVKGVVGMKVGGVRELTIPADMAYSGDQNQQHELYNLPLKFVVMVIPNTDIPSEEAISSEIKYPKGTVAKCLQAYASVAAQYGMTPDQLCSTYSNEEK